MTTNDACVIRSITLGFLEVESSTPVVAERSIPDKSQHGGLAQLARALDLHSRGHRFDSDILHFLKFSFKISEVL